MEEYLATDSLRFVIRVAHRSGSHWIRICEEYRSREAAAAALKRLRCRYPDAELQQIAA